MCFVGKCPPCSLEMEQNCLCGKQSQLRSCNDPNWSCGQVCVYVCVCVYIHVYVFVCDYVCLCMYAYVSVCMYNVIILSSCLLHKEFVLQVCGKTLPCGNHTCSRICHTGSCGDCPRKGTRHCPCGKTS